MTSVPDITRMLARIEDWKKGMGRADAARRLALGSGDHQGRTSVHAAHP